MGIKVLFMEIEIALQLQKLRGIERKMIFHKHKINSANLGQLFNYLHKKLASLPKMKE
jgi:hypothetical protein